MSTAGLWFILVACSGKADPEPTAEPITEQVQASESQGAMYKALSARDGGPTCAEVEALSETPVDDLVWLTEHVTSPPTVGVRAATCLIAGHAEEVADLLRAWVIDPTTAGFAAVVLGNLGLMPIALAVELATLALTEGPDPEGARERIARHEDPALQALVSD